MLHWGDFQTEREFLEYHAARYIWKRRNEPTPSGAYESWISWFAAKFGRSLDEARADFLARLEVEG